MTRAGSVREGAARRSARPGRRRARAAWASRLGALALGALAAGVATPRSAAATLREAASATTELDVARAAALLAEVDGDDTRATLERARLALYQGDCITAAAILAAPTLAEVPDAEPLRRVAVGCAGATAGARVVEDRARGIWIRLQDSRDDALVPFISAAATRATAYLEGELGVDFPRPLRIELVRDLFSLSALTGLPVEAAETTGTVGVARWGRVILLSPRATPRGYPWEDTLAHELVHLFVTRATRDHAPLWLQEGIAKLHESRWRPPRPFDDEVDPDETARVAVSSGRAVGIDGLGQSIALLPTPEQAASAYAEVTSFVAFLRQAHGWPALRLLFADLRGLGGHDGSAALRSVTGYELAPLRARWERALLERPAHPPAVEPTTTLTVKGVLEVRDVVRRVRLAELLARRGHHSAALAELEPALAANPDEPSLRWRAARAALGAERPDRAREMLGNLDGVSSAHGGWFALHGRFVHEANDRGASDAARAISVAIDPLLEDVACLGYAVLPPPVATFDEGEGAPAAPHFRPPAASAVGAVAGGPGIDGRAALGGDALAMWQPLCRAARAIPAD